MAISERLNRDGSRSYRARVKDPDGRWYPSVWYRNRDEAADQEAEQQKLKRRGNQAFSPAEARSTTVQEYWDVWKENNRPKVSAGWKISQDQMYRDYVSPVLGTRTMFEIRAPYIGRVLTRMRQMGRGPQLQKHVYTLLRKMFGDAVGYYKMLQENPVNAQFHGVDVPEGESEFLEPAQAWILLTAARNHPKGWGPAIWVETLAGLRTEAMVALRWECVLWDSNQILVCCGWKQKTRTIEPYPKGKKAQYVPVVPPLREYLWELWQKCQDPKAFVCPGPKGGQLASETYAPRLKKLCRMAGIPEISPHILRHSCTELFVREGASQEDIGRLLHHRNPSTTKRYMHRTEDRLNAIAGRVQGPELRVIEGGESYPRNYPHGKEKAYVSGGSGS